MTLNLKSFASKRLNCWKSRKRTRQRHYRRACDLKTQTSEWVTLRPTSALSRLVDFGVERRGASPMPLTLSGMALATGAAGGAFSRGKPAASALHRSCLNHARSWQYFVAEVAETPAYNVEIEVLSVFGQSSPRSLPLPKPRRLRLRCFYSSWVNTSSVLRAICTKK